MDTSKVNNIQDKILQSIEIVLNERLQSVEFDTTVLCTILDDSEREKGKYQVTNGNITFTAYSDDTRYRKNNEVYVLIPEGNYDNQKVILSKKTNDTVDSVMVTSPFDSIVDVSGNILTKLVDTSGNVLTNLTGKLLANSSEKYTKNNEEYIRKVVELYNSAVSISAFPIGVDGMRLGLKANFKSYIGNAVSGHYGILLEMVVEEEDAEQKQEEVVVEENQNEAIKENKTRTISFGIDSSEMIGNPYDFESFYTQEKVYDLEKEGITKIHSIKLIFYQNADFLDRAGYALDCSEGGFKRENGKTLKDEDGKGDWILNQQSEDGISDMFFEPNLFVEDIYLCLGQDIKKYENDFIELYTNDDKTYNGGEEKNIGMHWIYVNEGVKINLGTASEERIKKEGIKEIRWYKYEMGQTADAYSGFNWVRINPINGEVLQLINNYWCNDQGKQLTPDEIEDIKLIRQCKFYPRGTKNTEQLKVIIIQKKDDQEYVETYRSNTFVLTNNKQVVDAAQGTVERTSINIVPSDGSNGIYTIYGKNYSIVDTITNVKNSELVASFDFKGNGEYTEIAEAELAGLTWTIPAEFTMIDLNDSEKGTPIKDNERVIAYQIKGKNRIKYRPAMSYNPSYNNNVITCSYKYQGHEYIFNYTMIFGTSGTMGTDSTLAIRFADNRVNCIDLTNSDKTEYELILQMNDSNNQPVNLAGKENIEWSWFNGDKYPLDTSIINLTKNDKTPKATITLTLDNNDKKDWIKNKLFIVQASIGELVTYFPIPIKINPIKDDSGIDYITGPSQVIYQSDGNVHYMNQAYNSYPTFLIQTEENKRQRVGWRLVFDYLKPNEYIEVEKENNSEAKFNAGLYYIKSGDENYIWCDPTKNKYNSENQYFVVITKAYSCYRGIVDKKLYSFDGIDKTELENYIMFLPNLEEDGTLIPLATYIKEAPVFGVQAVVINEKYNGYNWEYDSTGETLWTQPVLTIQNKYPSTSIDNWSGKGIQMNESEGTIMSAAIAAGRKNPDNTFSGVILGDWREGESALTEHTGIYGFSNGEMSYSFAEDGTAFIGKASSGRIYFDGNKSTIYSAEWDESKYSDSYDIIDKDAGAMCIDLNKPSMYLVYPENKTTYKTIHLDASKNGKIISPPENVRDIEENEICLSRNENKIINIEKAPFRIGSNFCVDWDGNLVAKNGQLMGTISADAGQIGGWGVSDNNLFGSDIIFHSHSSDSPGSSGTLENSGTEGLDSSYLSIGELVEEYYDPYYVDKKIFPYRNIKNFITLVGSKQSEWTGPFGRDYAYEEVKITKEQFNRTPYKYYIKTVNGNGEEIYIKQSSNDKYSENTTYYTRVWSGDSVVTVNKTDGSQLMLNDSLLIGSSIYLDGTLSFYNYRETRDEGLYNRVFNGYLGNIGYSTVDPADFAFPSPNSDVWNGFNGEAYGKPGLGMMYLPQSRDRVSMIKMDNEHGLYLMTKTQSSQNSFFIKIAPNGITMGCNGIKYFEIDSKGARIVQYDNPT